MDTADQEEFVTHIHPYQTLSQWKAFHTSKEPFISDVTSPSIAKNCEPLIVTSVMNAQESVKFGPII